jgi:hypothetical protein
VNYQTIKDAVREKRQDVLVLLEKIVANLTEIKGKEIHQRVVNDIESFFKRGRWDEAVTTSQEWKDFYIDYERIKKEPNSVVRALALKEMLDAGPGNTVPKQYATAKEQAIALGGTGLWKVISEELSFGAGGSIG